MLDEILQLASVIAQPSEQELPLLSALCTAAEDDLGRKLKDGMRPEDCGGSFACAAALLAAAGFLPCRGGGDVEQFSAGDVSVRTGGGGQVCEMAAAMRRQAASMMAGYCGDGEFAFLGVKG